MSRAWGVKAGEVLARQEVQQWQHAQGKNFSLTAMHAVSEHQSKAFLLTGMLSI
jgi:hypothetical protein